MVRRIQASQVADYFLWKSAKEKRPISNKKLQKLLYYAQAWHLVILGQPLFKDKIEAWVHGPAIREIYFKFREFGFDPIETKIDNGIQSQFNRNTVELLDSVWDIYGKYDAQYLELLTHSEAPWQEAREGLEVDSASDEEISLASMKKFYAKKLDDASRNTSSSSTRI